MGGIKKNNNQLAGFPKFMQFRIQEPHVTGVALVASS